uniref:Uncharacterized protein n=1 Tax=Romanomermis culicivorax TaxID=13658 RepID=A0A915JRQ2_ROMCU
MRQSRTGAKDFIAAIFYSRFWPDVFSVQDVSFSRVLTHSSVFFRRWTTRGIVDFFAPSLEKNLAQNCQICSKVQTKKPKVNFEKRGQRMQASPEDGALLTRKNNGIVYCAAIAISIEVTTFTFFPFV